ncbi:uncharacterized protein LOC143363205 [Halictus rubicundus]|uniref:uncharacterized protein LOC143363205 n=1 Tax=Halictus rubicundus TaxID=77578 RepID=UPI00403595FA
MDAEVISQYLSVKFRRSPTTIAIFSMSSVFILASHSSSLCPIKTEYRIGIFQADSVHEARLYRHVADVECGKETFSVSSDDYTKARNKAKAAEETSDLQSEAKSPLERRKRPAFTLEDSTSSDEAAVFYPAPDLKKQRNIAACSHSVGEESQGEGQEDEIHSDKQCSIGKLRKIF